MSLAETSWKTRDCRSPYLRHVAKGIWWTQEGMLLRGWSFQYYQHYISPFGRRFLGLSKYRSNIVKAIGKLPLLRQIRSSNSLLLAPSMTEVLVIAKTVTTTIASSYCVLARGSRILCGIEKNLAISWNAQIVWARQLHGFKYECVNLDKLNETVDQSNCTAGILLPATTNTATAKTAKEGRGNTRIKGAWFSQNHKTWIS